MPLVRQTPIDSQTSFALWHIEEDLSFFQSKFPLNANYLNESSRLQWYATRHLVNELKGEVTEVLKDEFGKPYLLDGTFKMSLSHTAIFAAAMLSKTEEVGIDIEMIRPKIERIAHKFLREDELAAIQPDEKIEKLILYWSAKESLYKLHGRKQLEFKSQLLIDGFDLQQKGTLKARIIADDIAPDELNVRYEFFEDHVLTYVVGL
jgi:4'-phosphopantetheinyl transferase